MSCHMKKYVLYWCGCTNEGLVKGVFRLRQGHRAADSFLRFEGGTIGWIKR